MTPHPSSGGWQPGRTAPRNGNTILVYGKPKNTKLLQFTKAGIHTAYWDPIDQAFCLTGGTWEGPFIKPKKWQPTPELPHP